MTTESPTHTRISRVFCARGCAAVEPSSFPAYRCPTWRPLARTLPKPWCSSWSTRRAKDLASREGCRVPACPTSSEYIPSTLPGGAERAASSCVRAFPSAFSLAPSSVLNPNLTLFVAEQSRCYQIVSATFCFRSTRPLAPACDVFAACLFPHAPRPPLLRVLNQDGVVLLTTVFLPSPDDAEWRHAYMPLGPRDTFPFVAFSGQRAASDRPLLFNLEVRAVPLGARWDRVGSTSALDLSNRFPRVLRMPARWDLCGVSCAGLRRRGHAHSRR